MDAHEELEPVSPTPNEKAEPPLENTAILDPSAEPIEDTATVEQHPHVDTIQ